MKVQRYKHNSPYSYALGATLTFELLKCHPEQTTRILICTATDDSEGMRKILDLCAEKHIPVEKNDKAFNILSPKGNCFVIGEFMKESVSIEDGNHIVLVNPSDAGNLGTIIRTATGFGIPNIAIVRPAVDFYDPRTIRASMGAAFHVRIEYFDSIEDYISRFPQNKRYAFMLTASKPLFDVRIEEPYSLLFGNEATGLPSNFADFCQGVRIIHSSNIDSLNLPMAVGISMYEFTKKCWRTEL